MFFCFYKFKSPVERTSYTNQDIHGQSPQKLISYELRIAATGK